MRGLPPFQALLLLVILTALGFAGSHYISLGVVSNPQTPKPDAGAPSDTVEAEIELHFSSPPLSYRLLMPPEPDGEETVILESSKVTENPCYGSVRLAAHRTATYWLDVRWPDKPAENFRHFVRIGISPSHGEGKDFAFFSGYEGIEESFEYSTGGEAHE